MIEVKSDHYTLAGWLAIVSAVLFVSEVALAVFLKFLGLELFITPVHVANLFIGIYLLLKFRSLLNHQFGFYAADILITIMIVVNIVFFIIGMVEFSASTLGLELEAQQTLPLITMVLFVPFSLLTILFGAVLLKMKDDLFGLLKPYAFTTIGSGVCGATIILAPLGLLAAVIALVIMGMIFLRARREAEFL
jgi:hypothetical protein